MSGRARVLVSARDPRVRTAARRALWSFEVIEATDDVTTRGLAVACRPRVLVVAATDATMTLAVVDPLRRDFRTSSIPVVYVVDDAPIERLEDAIGGADDCASLAHLGDELSVRVRMCLLRAAAPLTANPLTGLPANAVVREEISSRLSRGTPFEMLHLDLDGFKQVNDRRGFARGDEVIGTAARCMVRSLEDAALDGCFAGHVGGDDFVVLVPPGAGAGLAAEVASAFDAAATGCSMSVGIAEATEGDTPEGLAERAAVAKSEAKKREGSSWAACEQARIPSRRAAGPVLS